MMSTNRRSTPIDAERTAALRRALAHVNAGYAIASDPECDPRLAMPHLTQAWLWAATASRSELEALDAEEVTAWLGENIPNGKTLAYLDGLTRLSATQGPERPSESTSGSRVPRAEVLFELRRTRSLIERERAGSKSPRPRWAHPSILAALGIAASVLVLGVGIQPWSAPDGAWRAAYHRGQDFQGEPKVIRDLTLDFDWGGAAPMDAIPSDHFSVQWDTCLKLDDASSPIFQLVVDGRATLLVDGEVALELQSSPKRVAAKGAEVSLNAGVHHLQVRYRVAEGDAQVHLLAAFDHSAPPLPIPGAMMRHPREGASEPWCTPPAG